MSPFPQLHIAIACPRRYPLDRRRVRRVVGTIMADAGVQYGELSLAVVDDAQMYQLNSRYLEHNYTTDVLSFRLDEGQHPGWLDGEVIACGDTARREAERIGWGVADELLLYFIHGCLHLVGYEDADPAQRRRMRRAECYYLGQVDPALAERHAETNRLGKRYIAQLTPPRSIR
ncbi:MAG: hypothetical protein KatS3mg110_3654 [Pirellulaceae bacterium]|nr:MAG: hypothetical protein KatS3mg110_3654 [Pirellulaceae bacterium]